MSTDLTPREGVGNFDGEIASYQELIDRSG